MLIRALGPLSILDKAQRPISVSPKPRQVLALLVTHVDHAVSQACFLQELWEDNPPRTATTALQTYVGQLRRVLSQASGLSLHTISHEVLVTVGGGGYLLSSGLLGLDLVRYLELDRAGRDAARTGDHARASELLRGALALWRGPALVNVESGTLLASQIARLEESRLNTQENRIFADLQLGEHYALVAELADLTARHPLHETLHGHMMLALYRCGRRADALAVLRGLRERLVTELGLDPSPFLTALERAILRGDSCLDLTGRDGAAEGRRAVVR